MPMRYPTPAGKVRTTALGIRRLLIPLLALSILAPGWLRAADLPLIQALPGQHADRAFQELSRHERQASQLDSEPPHRSTSNGAPPSYSSDEYLRGIGEGDLSKGRLACQRVAELAARTDLAKQIRVRVTEHAIDRLRERMDRTTEQELEVVREEMVNELLRDVRIIDRRTDQAAGTCSSIAVMPKSRIVPEGAPETRGQSTPPSVPAR